MNSQSKYYIVYFDNITQYDITNKGYYVGYKNKIEDHYSDDYIFAKRYKNLSSALNRAYINWKGYSSYKILKKIENNEFFMSDVRIEIVKISNTRKRKLDKITSSVSEPIKNLGEVSKEEFYDFFKKEADKFITKNNYVEPVLEKNATEEDIDDFCLHMNNVLNH